MNDSTASNVGPRIYNLFPLLAGTLPQWMPHLQRARQMEFNWVFLNPFHLAGHSGSLYAIKDYFAIDPRLTDPTAGPPETQLRRMIEGARALGLKVMMDLVINHTAFDSPLVEQHPTWYRRGADGKPIHPGTQDGNKAVTWGDLFEIENSSDRDGLWSYWINLAQHYASMGIEGFRCDAAYKVSSKLWQTLIRVTKAAYPSAQFFAESLGCPHEDTLKLAQSGFGFIFNSSKWWDFTAPWCLKQYRDTADLVPSVSFPESHDTERLAAELNADQQAVRMRYAFAALFSTGVMMPMGFEYGFHRRLNVVNTRPQDWETPVWDLSDFICRVNRLKESRRVFNEEGPTEAIDVGNSKILGLVKRPKGGGERVLILFNKDMQNQQAFRTQTIGHFLFGTTRVDDISPDGSLQHTTDFQTCFLKRSGFHVVSAS
jgi:starch synthase (maltosyl-transferring)